MPLSLALLASQVGSGQVQIRPFLLFSPRAAHCLSAPTRSFCESILFVRLEALRGSERRVVRIVGMVGLTLDETRQVFSTVSNVLSKPNIFQILFIYFRVWVFSEDNVSKNVKLAIQECLKQYFYSKPKQKFLAVSQLEKKVQTPAAVMNANVLSILLCRKYSIQLLELQKHLQYQLTVNHKHLTIIRLFIMG